MTMKTGLEALLEKMAGPGASAHPAYAKMASAWDEGWEAAKLRYNL